MIHARDDYNDLAALDARIPAAEPVFLIRGQDSAGPAAVRAWADEAAAQGADSVMVQAARNQALRMDLWQETNRCHTPDMP